MYSLALPVWLPEDRSFHIDGRASVPPLVGGLTLGCETHSENFPLVLKVSGLPDSETALEFAPKLASAIRYASLELGYSLRPSDAEPSVTTISAFDGGSPTVFETTLAARPMTVTAYACMSEHLITLAKQLDDGLATGRVERLMEYPQLSVAVRLFSEVEFAGGETAKFVVLLSALEVLIPKSPGGKRSRVRALVTKALREAGRTDAKEMGRNLDAMYEVRNELIHEARPVASTQVRELSEIVRETLRSLVHAL